MNKTITAVLQTIQGGTYHRKAPVNAAFPYKVFSYKRLNTGNRPRSDESVIIDVYDKATNAKTVELIADKIEQAFEGVNLPQTEILPTFYVENRYPVEEDDPIIQHIQLEIISQLYTTQ